MAWSDQTISAVWAKGTVVQNNNPDVYRKDQCGAWIQFSQYGNRNSIYGWEIDHITAKANGGTDILSNLRPLQWKNNCFKQEGRLRTCMTAQGETNVEVNK